MNVAFRSSRLGSSRRTSRRGLTLLELVMVVSILAILTALVVPGMGDQQEETRKTVARATMQDLRDIIANRYLNDMQTLPQPDLAFDNSGRLSTTVSQLNLTTTGLPQMHFLFVAPRYATTTTNHYVAVNDFDSQSRIGWNGPYVMAKSTTYPNTVTTTAGRRFPSDPNNTETWSDYGFTTQHGQFGDYSVMDPWGSPYVIIVRQSLHGNSTVFTSHVVSAGPDRRLQTTAVSLTTGDDLLLPIKAVK